ncbi:hypothetical protein CTA1_9177 [Colletotrichum tanaceti]|uniref:Uncharacterized protein n=1 Tax=Colletotrichum tanaceti TaxID=1306861 RepID=A0A4V6DJZ3_9PEZI|nr:hypothetical protein CTA1_9177 [Colletotrichum tanaceti]
MAMMALKGGADIVDDVLSSSSGVDDAPRVVLGDGDFEVDLEDKVLEWSDRAGGELASLTAEEAIARLPRHFSLQAGAENSSSLPVRELRWCAKPVHRPFRHNAQKINQ